MIYIAPTYCPGDPCDPCKVGTIVVSGNYSGFNVLGFARGSIISFPEFPVSIEARIYLKGIYRPFVGYIDSDGGFVNLIGFSNSVQVLLPLGINFLKPMAGWDPSGSDLLHFDVVAKSSTTSLATIDITTVSVSFQADSGDVIDVWDKTRWTGNIE
jgi:hypothetical protein